MRLERGMYLQLRSVHSRSFRGLLLDEIRSFVENNVAAQ